MWITFYNGFLAPVFYPITSESILKGKRKEKSYIQIKNKYPGNYHQFLSVWPTHFS